MYWFSRKKEPHRPYHIGLALGGGGARGFAHVGVLRAFEERGIKVDILAGTSAGSIVCALYADGYTPHEIMTLFSEMNVRELVDVTLPRNGLLKFDKFVQFLENNLRARNIEELHIPTLITATDFDRGASIIFERGELPIRIAASCSIPIVFPPVIIDGTHYVDGGVMRNLPATPLRNLCDIVIGVNVSPLQREEYTQNLVSIADRAYNFLSSGNVFPDLALCDIVIESQSLSDFNVFDIKEQIQIEEVGYRNAIEVIEKLSPEMKQKLNI